MAERSVVVHVTGDGAIEFRPGRPLRFKANRGTFAVHVDGHSPQTTTSTSFTELPEAIQPEDLFQPLDAVIYEAERTDTPRAKEVAQTARRFRDALREVTSLVKDVGVVRGLVIEVAQLLRNLLG